MKSTKRKIGDVGIRLKPIEPNILENYTKYRKRVKRTKKKKKKSKPKRIKNIEIVEQVDPLLQIAEEKGVSQEDQPIELEPEPVKETKIVHVENKPKDLSETDPNVKKTLTITASLKPEKRKQGGGILIE